MIEENEEQPDIEEPLPEFGEIEGQQIKLAGLDYSLLPQQSAKDKKSKLMKQIKSKLSDFAYKMPVEKTRGEGSKLTFENDQLTKNILMSLNIKSSINHSSFYLFPTIAEFSPLQPELITRRFGRMHTEPLYINHPKNEVEQFRLLIKEDDKIKKLRKQQQLHAKKVIPGFEIDEGSDSDDIFGGNDSESSDKLKPPIAIKVGNKLSFGVDDSQIFGRPRYKQVVQEVEQEPKVVDKYDFLRKKRKINEDDDGYGECYAETGPSLEQMKQLKKQGIQLFGDAKQFVQKERKININADYAKIKRIIDEKSKKA